MKPIKLFFSYSHEDEDLCKKLVKHLAGMERKGLIETWHDRSIDAGSEWKTAIDDNLNQAGIILLLISHNFIASNYCYEIEMKRAMERHETGEAIVIPIILRPVDWGDTPFGKLQALPKNAKPVTSWRNRDEAFANVVQAIRRVVEEIAVPTAKAPALSGNAIVERINRVPFMAEDLPEGFVPRPDEFHRLKRMLLNQQLNEPVGITAALRGVGGYGKTTIAKALCHDKEIQRAFDDGILWVTLGDEPGDLISHIENLIEKISGERPGFTNLEAAISRLVELLADRDILLVIDDVWSRDHLRPFLQGGPRCARLITTRNLDTLPTNARTVKVDAMRTSEAVEILRAGLQAPGLAECHDQLRWLATRLGEWPLLLGLVNGALQDRVNNGNQPLPDAIAYVNQALDKRGLTFFDARDTESGNQAVAKTLGVSLELLEPAERARYAELAVFPEDSNIPLATLEKFWGKTGEADGFDAEFDTETLCARLNQFSLLHSFDLGARTIRLHDVIRTFLRDERRTDLPALNNQLLDAHRPAVGWAELPDDDRYFWDHLASHLIEAGRGKELVATVKDWRYLAKKTLLCKSLSVENDLIQAVKYAPDDDPLRALRRSFANTGHIFNHCETREDLQTTLFSRLQHPDELQSIMQELKRSLSSPRIVPKFNLPDLPHPALIRTIEGHSDSVWGCAPSPDGKLIVSASFDRTLIIWDSETGQLLRTLEGHLKYVTGCAFSLDGKLIVSASDDRTLKVWDAATGQMLRSLEGHSDSVRGCAFSPDGKLVVSASDDRTLKVWDAATGQMLRSLEGHSDSVWGCAFSPDGRLIVSASDDRTLKAWDAEAGQILRSLEGHSAYVNSCAFSSDGRLIVSASDDRTLKVWDAVTGQMLRSLEGHSAPVRGCAFSPDGEFIVSASLDRTLKVWDAGAGQMLRSLEGHSDSVRGCAFSPDGRLVVSASWDRTITVWDAATGQMLRSLEGHSAYVNGCAFSPDGKLVVSASWDRTLKVWDAGTGQMLRSLEGHSDSVRGCAFSPDGRLIVSASDDRTLKVWDAEAGQILGSLEGHSAYVNGCAFSPDGRLIVSASLDRTLKVWDAEARQMLRSLEGHSAYVSGCAFSPDGRLVVSASWDRTLKVWDAATGQMLRSLEGHSDSVRGCAFSPDGELIVSASWDRTLKAWDAATGKTLATFFADGPMLCCTIHGEMIVAGGARGVYFLRLVR